MQGADSPLSSSSGELELNLGLQDETLGYATLDTGKRLWGVDDTIVTDVERRLMGRARIENAVGTGLGGLRTARRRDTGSRRPGLG